MRSRNQLNHCIDLVEIQRPTLCQLVAYMDIHVLMQVNLCASLYRTYPSINFQDKIGVITFYNKQKELIRRKLQEHRKQWETSHTSVVH